MLKKILLIILIVINSISFAQKHIIVDSIDNKPIQFVTIKFSENGLYSNEKGEFFIDIKTIDKISFSHINYYNLEIEGIKCSDTIRLTPKTSQLADVLVGSNKETARINYLKQAKSYSSFPLDKNVELLSFIIPINITKNFDIKTFFFKGASARGIKDDTNFKSVIRINFYSLNKDKIINKVYSSPPIYILPNTDQEYSVDLSKQSVEFNQSGFAIGIESIGVVDRNGNFSEKKNYIRIALTNKSSSNYKQTTFLNYTFSNKPTLLSINKALQIDDGKSPEYNLQFQCDLF